MAAVLPFACALAADAPWRAEEFPIGFWHGPPAEFNTLESWEKIRDCNFNFCGPARPFSVEENHKMLDFCRRVGLRAMVVDGRISWQMVGDDRWKETVRRVVSDYGGHPALFGYYLQDEPNSGLFEALGQLNREFRALDPGRLPYINLFPTYASTKQLGHPTYADHLESFMKSVAPAVLSYDHYSLMKDGTDRKDYFENLSLIRDAALRWGVPPWNIILSIPHFGYRDPTAAEMRWQVYTSLAYGMKGIMYFTYWTEPEWEKSGGIAIVDSRGNPGRLYPIVQGLNAEMRVLGRTLLGLRSTGVFHSGEIPLGSRRIGRDAALFPADEPPLAIGFFSDDAGNEYAMPVNCDHSKPLSCELILKPHITGISEISATDGKPADVQINSGRMALRLDAGDGRLLKLEKRFCYPRQTAVANRISFEFDADDDFEGWGEFVSLQSPAVIGGALKAILDGADPHLTRRFMRLEPDACGKIKVRMKMASGQPSGQIFWITEDEPQFDDSKYMNFPIKPDGQWHEYEIPVSSHEKWRGKTIRGMRLDPTTGGAKPGDSVEIDWIIGI